MSRGALVIAVLDRWSEPEPAAAAGRRPGAREGRPGETAVGTLTEVGVDVIVPWAAARSVTRWSDERAPKALERWRSAARESAKQSRRVAVAGGTCARLDPRGRGPASAAPSRLVLHEEAASPWDVWRCRQLATSWWSSVRRAGSPRRSWPTFGCGPPPPRRPYASGPSVLRTSTAGTAAASVLLARRCAGRDPGSAHVERLGVPELQRGVLAVVVVGPDDVAALRQPDLVDATRRSPPSRGDVRGLRRGCRPGRP